MRETMGGIWNEVTANIDAKGSEDDDDNDDWMSWERQWKGYETVTPVVDAKGFEEDDGKEEWKS